MSRLVHSFNGLIKRIQISTDDLFFFTEGKTDVPVFDSFLESYVENKEITYTKYRLDQIAGSGGKNAVLKYFDEFQSRGLLIDDFKGKISVSVFCVDSDVERPRYWKGRISPHLIKTGLYNIENILFRYGDLKKAIIFSASVDSQFVRQFLPDPNKWRKETAENWKEWVTLCYFAKRNGCTQANYSNSTSMVNENKFGPFNQDLFDGVKAQLQINWDSTKGDFNKRLKDAEKSVERFYRNDEFDQIFNGKWYKTCLINYIKSCARTEGIQCENKFDGSLIPTLASHLDFKGDWVKQFTEPMDFVLRQAGLLPDTV